MPAAKNHTANFSYGPDLFKYIEGNKHIYSRDVQQRQLLSDLTDSAARIVFLVSILKAVKDEKDPAKKRAAVKAELPGMEKRVTGAKSIGSMNKALVDRICKDFLPDVVKALKEREYIAKLVDEKDMEELAKIAALAITKHGFSSLDTTGIVVAGYGDDEYFPRLKQYTVYGLVLGKLIFEEGKEHSIDQANVSEIVPFAQANMIKTFIYGMMPNAIDEIETLFSKAADYLQSELVSAGKLTPADDIDEIKKKAKDQLSDALADSMVSSHTMPLRRVIGLLPVDELAELAEILISIESLKERVTTESESVGGPIDVALISKGDGFVWIKRKHYFEPELNPRFFARKGMGHARPR